MTIIGAVALEVMLMIDFASKLDGESVAVRYGTNESQ